MHCILKMLLNAKYDEQKHNHNICFHVYSEKKIGFIQKCKHKTVNN